MKDVLGYARGWSLRSATPLHQLIGPGSADRAANLKVVDGSKERWGEGGQNSSSLLWLRLASDDARNKSMDDIVRVLCKKSTIFTGIYGKQFFGKESDV